MSQQAQGGSQAVAPQPRSSDFAAGETERECKNGASTWQATVSAYRKVISLVGCICSKDLGFKAAAAARTKPPPQPIDPGWVFLGATASVLYGRKSGQKYSKGIAKGPKRSIPPCFSKALEVARGWGNTARTAPWKPSYGLHSQRHARTHLHRPTEDTRGMCERPWAISSGGAAHSVHGQRSLLLERRHPLQWKAE